MRDLIPAALRRLGLALLLGAAAGMLPATVAAQAIEPLWVSKACAGCHSPVPTATTPPNMADVIDFTDATLFSSLSNFIGRITKAASNQTMKDFGNGVTSTAGERQAVYDYLVNVRNAVVTASGTTFAATDVGVQSATTRTVTLVNYRGEDLNFTPSLNNSTDFSFTTNCPSAPRRVAAQSSCTVSVTFTPTQASATSRASDLTIDFTSGTSFVPTDRVFSFTGTVNPPLFNFSANAGPFSGRIGVPTDINFGTLRNTGSATLVLSGIVENPASAVFSLSPVDLAARPNACTTTQQLGDNATCQLWVRFTAAAQGLASATFRFSHNAAGSPNDVVVSATGRQPLISPTSAALNFGSVQQGATSTPQAVLLTNTGNLPFTFTADPKLAGARSGANPNDFAVTTSCNSDVNQTVATSCTISVTFSPPLAAPAGVARTATLTVNTDADNNLGVLSVTLSGTPVVLPEPTLTSPASDFPDTVIGQTSASTLQIVITNPRTHAIGYSYSDPADFRTAGQACTSGAAPTVPPGGSCTLTMEFRPLLSGGEVRRTVNVPFSFTGSAGDPAPATLNASLAGRALMPLGAPTSLAPTARVTIPGTVSTVLTNRSVSAITLNALSFAGAAAGDYSLDATSACTPGLSIPSSGTCTLVVRFDPAAAGTRIATLTLGHTALGSPQTITLNGDAAPAPQGRIELSSFSLTFPSTQLNGSAAQSITVRNSGDLALNFSAFTLGGAAAGDYSRSGDCSSASPLAIGAQCTLTLTFQPTALGTRAASLTIQSDASNGPATVTLSGTGVPIPAPQVSLAPGSLDFGTQTVGNLYPARTIRLSNSGTADLHTTAVVVEGGAFATSSTCPATLAPGAGCDVQILFAPVVANTDYAGTLRVTSDAAGSPHTAALTGRGSVATLAALTWSPLVSSLDFGTVSAGTLSPVQTVTLLNQGPGGVSLTVRNTVGPDAAAFAVTGGTCTVGQQLFEGQTCTIDVRFAPASAGDKTATVQIASTGSFPPVLSLTGTGLGGPSPGLAVSAAALSFDSTRVGAQSLPTELTLSSTGSGVVRVTAMEVSGPYTMQSKTCPALPFTLPAGSECTVVLSFVPQAEGDAAGSLRVTSSADPATREVALSGRGEAKADLSSGGCSMIDGESAADPTLWTLVLLAAIALLVRRRARAARRDRP